MHGEKLPTTSTCQVRKETAVITPITKVKIRTLVGKCFWGFASTNSASRSSPDCPSDITNMADKSFVNFRLWRTLAARRIPFPTELPRPTLIAWHPSRTRLRPCAVIKVNGSTCCAREVVSTVRRSRSPSWLTIDLRAYFTCPTFSPTMDLETSTTTAISTP